MNTHLLQTLFPTGYIKSTYDKESSDLIIPIDNGFFYLSKQDISQREATLLTELMIKQPVTKVSNGHLWYDYLFNQVEMPTSSSYYRIIQIRIRKDATNKKMWLTHFSKLFDSIVDSFFIDETSAILVEQQTTILYSTEDIRAMLLTLEGEFLIQATAFVGKFQQVSPTFITCFKEEQTIFNQFFSHFHPNDVFVFEEVALEYLTKKAIKESALMTNLYQSTIFDEETVLMIKTLWTEQGNMTSSAKKLYTHRNTLQYKLDKFSEQTGISLKNMTELTLCYLMILSL
ncbi:helix-turn-helix domain-containing protein [Vagococcus bubulae]|uniref:PucR C-terminal helix-turn-helix domain-containing protein n=1 Tax=Vagococcus bubulae TaxID=1977868 RepID=A0A429ZLS9_9ENTE|nr:helix-turn-helix domain-containing protein [Vagococcus bubulae]RST94655.1 hypothetical protein CBF36_05475 [Vagococcus bubulae]